MKQIELRLFRGSKVIRNILVAGSFLGILRGLSIVVWSYSFANLIAFTVAPKLNFYLDSDATETVLAGIPDTENAKNFLLLAVLGLVLRALSTWLIGVLAERGAVRVKHDLRSQTLTKITRLGPDWLSRQSDAAVALRMTRGLDALDRYFAEYLPQLLLTIFVTPIIVGILFIADPLSALTVIIVFPVIPIFMALIGLATTDVMKKQWRALTELSRSYLDLLRGLATLKLFGRQWLQVERVRDIARNYRLHTMKVLRVTFLSGFVLDLAGTFSVALVAVTVGTKLVAGDFALVTSLFVLLLVPEAFIPIRQVGASFHASAEGREAAGEIFEILDVPVDDKAVVPERDPQSEPAINAKQVTVMRYGKELFEPLTFRVGAGEIVVLTGSSGVGKSSLMAAILGTVPLEGHLRVTGGVSWSGRRHGLLRGTVASNVALGDENPDPGLIKESLYLAQILDVLPEQKLQASGAGLSGGQKSRVSIARAFYNMKAKNAGLLLLDEPTVGFDSCTEEKLLQTLTHLARSGAAILIATHSPKVIAIADREVKLKEPVLNRELGLSDEK